MRLKKFLNEVKEDEYKAPKYAVLGVNQDQDVCDVCGKCNLKKVVWFSKLNSQGEQIDAPFATGVDCAAKLMMSGGRKPSKGKMDSIWKAAKGIDKAKEFILKYKTEKELKKVVNFLQTKYPLNVLLVNHPVDGDPLGLIIWDSTDTNSMWTLSVTGVNKRWPEKTKEVAARNWLRTRHGK